MPRQPYPAGQARTVKLFTKVRPSAADAFARACEKASVTKAEGIRLALADWIKKIGAR